MPLFAIIAAQWADWRERGIPPGCEWRGRGAQNPRLLAAFAVLDRARAAVEAEQYEAREAAQRTAAARKGR